MVEQIADRTVSSVLASLEAGNAADGDDGDGLFDDVAKQIKKMVQSGGPWSKAMLSNLQKAMYATMKKATQDVAALDRLDDYAIQQAAHLVRKQLRKMFQELNPPPEVMDSEEYQMLLALLFPETHGENSGFKKGKSGMRGKVKGEVQQRQIGEAIEKLSRRAASKDKSQLSSDLGGMAQFSKMSLEHMARMLRRRIKKSKSKVGVDEDGNIALDGIEDIEDPEALHEAKELQALLNLFNEKALETMRLIREEIAPTWAPESQPWLVQSADRAVYDIVLAVIPKELFEETAAYQELQDLRRGQGVFTLRAADKLTEATRRNK